MLVIRRADDTSCPRKQKAVCACDRAWRAFKILKPVIGKKNNNGLLLLNFNVDQTSLSEVVYSYKSLSYVG